ncbi:MAG: inositol monophosphatase family protein [Bermanella sp.]
MADHESILAFTTQLAEQAGDLIVQMRANAQLSLAYKQDIELVTNADIASDEIIIQSIREKFPSHQILAEESSPDLSKVTHDDTPLWIIDPIDGTVNYAHHHQQVAVSIAYCVKGRVQVAVVYCPFQAEMFGAIRNQGAWLNDQPIRCGHKKDMQKTLIATGFPYDKQGKLPQLMAYLTAVLAHCGDIRRLGSAALDICWVAMGRLDGYYESVSVWDCAAALLIASEAGAKCGHFVAPPLGVPKELHPEHLLVSNPQLFAGLQTILEDASLSR